MTHKRFIVVALALVATAGTLRAQRSNEVNVKEHIGFEVQVSVKVEGPAAVKAGEQASFTVAFDQPPNFEGAQLTALFVTSNGKPFSISAAIPAQNRTLTISFLVPIDAEAGTWVLKELTVTAGHTKRVLQLRSKIEFQVVPASGVVFPSSAEVTINLSQVQLLRKEANTLQRRVQDLKARLLSLESDSKAGHNRRVDLLVGEVRSAVTALNETESSFRRLSTSPAMDCAARIFFDDLRRSYEDAAKNLHTAHAQTARLVLASQTSHLSQPYPLVAQPVLRSFEQNELAYSVVADTQSLTFDLDVQSVPAGARISYHRKNDPYQVHPNETNSTIKSLPYAIWFVRLEKAGYRIEEREHDPFREPNHVVIVQLKK